MTDEQHEDERAGLPSASGIERLMHCPGSKAAEDASPPKPASEIADQGSRIHEARQKEDGTGLTDEELEIAHALTEIEIAAVAAWKSEKQLSVEPSLAREERIWIREPGTLRPIASAKLDWYYRADVNALVVDDKTGFLAVTPSPKNWQLRVQALGVYGHHKEVKEIRVAIAQYRFKARYDACDYSPADLEASMDELLHGLWKAEQLNQQRVPGYWCRYCRAKASCPEANAYALLPVAVVSGGEPLEGLRGEKLKAALAARVGLLDPRALAFLYSKRSIIEGVLEATKERLKAMPVFELAEIGLALGPKSTVTSIGDLTGCLNILFAKKLITPEEFTACCTVALGKVLEVATTTMVKEKRAATKKAADEFIRTLLAGVMVTTERAPSIIVLDPEPAKVEQQPEAQPQKPPAKAKPAPAKPKKRKKKHAKASHKAHSKAGGDKANHNVPDRGSDKQSPCGGDQGGGGQ